VEQLCTPSQYYPLFNAYPTFRTVRVLFTLHSTPKTEARAFSFFALSANIAIFLGPFIGGLFAQPATQFPRIPRLFHVYPYFLPTLVTGLYALSAAIVAALWLDEPKVVENRKVLDSTTNADGFRQESDPNEPPSYKQVLKSEGVILALTVYGLISLLAIGFTASTSLNQSPSLLIAPIILQSLRYGGSLPSHSEDSASNRVKSL
jgi:MFS family permease